MPGDLFLGLGFLGTGYGVFQSLNRFRIMTSIKHLAQRGGLSALKQQSSVLFPGKYKEVLIKHKVREDPVYLGNQYSKIPIGGGYTTKVLYNAAYIRDCDDVSKKIWTHHTNGNIFNARQILSYEKCLEMLKEQNLETSHMPLTNVHYVEFYETPWLTDNIRIMKHPMLSTDWLIGTERELECEYAKQSTPLTITSLVVGGTMLSIGLLMNL